MSESEGKQSFVQYLSGTEEWYFNGKLHWDNDFIFEDSDGTKRWYFNDESNQGDGSAIEYPNGTREWSLNGKLHRVNEPAVEWEDGTKHWYLNGKLHRIDGPAVEYLSGTKFWFINGVCHRQSEYFSLLKIRNFHSKIMRSNNALGFNLERTLKLSRNKAVVEWYYSPDQGGGKLAKEKLALFVESKL